ncbi:hypothetical protein VNI00_009400 [Paramarasmius palmivorus]|uniref:Uncharacterized protein n=1 Tax=Paramarasmius palmivorus TaxID=297713 RepID=A0AAW0CUF3_9AGAR
MVELGTSTTTSWLLGGLVGMVLLKQLVRYISLERLDALRTDIEDIIADHDERGLLPSIFIFNMYCDRLKRRVSLHKYAWYTIDKASWKTYTMFFIWNWWKEPLAIYWAAGKLRRSVLAEGEEEGDALENHRALRRRNLPLHKHALLNV